jgi:PAS domain S-box-containing protein
VTLFLEKNLSCTPETTVLEAITSLKDSKKSSLIILRNQLVQGIWTEADVLNLNLSNPAIFDKPISEFMTSPVFLIHEDKLITEATELMLKNKIRHLVVVDDENKAIGVITPRDIIHREGAEAFLTVKDVKSVAFQNPYVINESLPVINLADLMKKECTDILIVNLDYRPIFSFTQRDLIELIVKHELNSTLDEIDIKPLITISQDLSILVARQLMDIKNVKHLAVVDDKGNFTKILSNSDILASLENSYKKLLHDININNSQSEIDSFTQLLANAVHQTAGMMIITDCHGDIEYVNESFEKMTGFTLDEIKGKNPRFLSSGIIPKSVFKQMWTTLNLGKTWKGELCNKKKSGARYWVLSSITPITNNKGEVNHFFAVEEDITEKKEIETRLHEIEQRFYRMIDRNLIMTWEADINGQFINFNSTWHNSMGHQSGDGWTKYIHPDDLIQFLDAFQNSLVRRSIFCLDHRIKNAKGGYIWVMNSGSPYFDEDGQFKGFKGECVDISLRKKN